MGNDSTRALPCAMSLRLLNSKDEPIASELAPFAQSYDVSLKSVRSSIGGELIPLKHLRKRSYTLLEPFRNISLRERQKLLSGLNILAKRWRALRIGRASKRLKTQGRCG